MIPLLQVAEAAEAARALSSNPLLYVLVVVLIAVAGGSVRLFSKERELNKELEGDLRKLVGLTTEAITNQTEVMRNMDQKQSEFLNRMESMNKDMIKEIRDEVKSLCG